MKPSTVIYIAVSVLIMLLGMFICSAASAAAEASGTDIYYSKENEAGDMVFTYDFTENNIRKLAIETLDADINVIKVQGNSYIELINFADGTYTFSYTNRIVSLTNNTNLSNLLQFGTNNFYFDGLRHYLRGITDTTKEKKVNVYIGSDSAIQSVVLSATAGDISLSAISDACDYSVTASDGKVEISSLSSVGLFEFNGDNADITLKDIACDNFKAKLHNGSVSAANLSVTSTVFANTDAGNISLALTRPITEYKAKLNSVKGTVSVYGSIYEMGYNDPVENSADINLEVSVNTGNITIE
ncbi:MAG: DUF4097 family beta strand repeat protein [Clostridia bacterium]|nr:DUF4097 family beta strand repeat protein [Clostridia bacterium]